MLSHTYQNALMRVSETKQDVYTLSVRMTLSFHTRPIVCLKSEPATGSILSYSIGECRVESITENYMWTADPSTLYTEY